MRTILRFGILALLLTLPTAFGTTSPANQQEKYVLTTGYLFRPVNLNHDSSGPRTIGLQVTLHGNAGSGTINLDPNINWYNEFGDERGSTDMADHTYDVKLSAVPKEDPEKKGRRLFEIMGGRMQGRLFLVISPGKEEPHPLLIATKDGAVVFAFPLHTVEKSKA